MKQFTTQHTEKKLSLIPAIIPLPTVLYMKKNKLVIDYRIVFTIKNSYHVIVPFSHHRCQPLDNLQLIISFLWLGMGGRRTFEQFCFKYSSAECFEAFIL